MRYGRGKSSAAQTILREALKLSDDERLEVANELLASLDGPPDAQWDSTWLVELDRRSRDSAGPQKSWSALR
ncbi:MAG: addiction module protein [Myxococcaceae bacterium]|jgi:hypothetical protein|nr:addiction module protein [Myxococcaceae bacterium]